MEATTDVEKTWIRRGCIAYVVSIFRHNCLLSALGWISLVDVAVDWHSDVYDCWLIHTHVQEFLGAEKIWAINFAFRFRRRARAWGARRDMQHLSDQPATTEPPRPRSTEATSNMATDPTRRGATAPPSRRATEQTSHNGTLPWKLDNHGATEAARTRL